MGHAGARRYDWRDDDVMVSVDPGDDELLRYIVRHYRYDDAQHERGHVETGAVDNAVEFESARAQARAALTASAHLHGPSRLGQ
jgi:hypothetical protein